MRVSREVTTAVCLTAIWLCGAAPSLGADRQRDHFWHCNRDSPLRFLPPNVWDRADLPTSEKLGITLLHRSDYANSALWLVGVAGVSFGGEPPDEARWTSSGSFEDDVRDDLLANSRSGRDDAATASDVLLGFTVTAPVWGDVLLRSWLWKGDCEQAVDLFGEWLEAFSLTTLLTEATKIIAGRERPFQRECVSDPDYDDDCFDEDSRKSFFSGHASLSAAGAGVLCRNTYLRQEPVWGRWGSIRNPLPCALGIGAMVATGLLRIRADKHWFADVATGWAVGFGVGLFDLPGAFDLLKFKYRRESGQEVTGRVVPTATHRGVGARLAIRF